MSSRYFSMHRYFVVVAAAMIAWAVAAPAAAADNVTATYVGTIDKKKVSIAFKDVYAVRAMGSRGEAILVYLTDTPMDKSAMTAALRKHRKTSAITFGDFLDGKAKAQITIQGGEVTNLYIFQPPGLNLNAGGSEMLDRSKSEIKVVGSQLEGRFTAAGPAGTGSAGKFDVRFSVALADTGPGKPIED